MMQQSALIEHMSREQPIGLPQNEEANETIEEISFHKELLTVNDNENSLF